MVHNGSANGHLAHTTDEDLKFLTVANTFVTNSTVEVQRTGTKSPARGASAGESNNHYQAFIELRQLAHGREYSFDVPSECLEQQLLLVVKLSVFT